MCDQHGSEFNEVAMVGIFDLDDSPRILPSPNLFPVDFNKCIGPDHGKRNGVPEVLHLLLVVFIFITETPKHFFYDPRSKNGKGKLLYLSHSGRE